MHTKNDTFECEYCGSETDRADMSFVNDDSVCQSCRDEYATCVSCDRMVHEDDYYVLGYYDNVYCSDCTETCAECSRIVPNGETYWCEDVNENCCEDCAHYCDTCGEHYVHECCSGDGTLLDYGHTYPSRWLGGPLPKDEKGRQIGYYLGFELEINTSELTANHVSDWSLNTLGCEAFECKEDSTVSGFEIVSQPMTPTFFESVDWEGFFKMLNDMHPTYNDEEPEAHGLHVHVGRVAFGGDDLTLAAWAYLIGQGDHLERIGRRQPTGYCQKVARPASAAIVHRKPYTPQGSRLRYYAAGRDAINFLPSDTVEVRAFRSTRSANELRDAVRMVYLTVEYVRELRPNRYSSIPPNALHWNQFAQWVKQNHPEAYVSIAGIKSKPRSNRKKRVAPMAEAVNYTF